MNQKDKRSNRIKNNKNKKEKVKQIIKSYGNKSILNLPRKLGVAFSTHNAVCSCHMCGNPRKFYNKKSLQELKHEYKEDLSSKNTIENI